MIFLEAKAFLCDMDGTLVDSERAVEHAWQRWCQDVGVESEQVLRICHGVPSLDTIRTVAPHLDAQAESMRLEAYECLPGGVCAKEGAVSLLGRVARERWAVVTSARLPVARYRLELCGLPEPGALVTIEQLAQGKPAPDPFLLGAQRLGYSPADCLAFEDSDAGIASAIAAGCRVVQVGEAAAWRPGVVARIAHYRHLDVWRHGEWLVLELPDDGLAGPSAHSARAAQSVCSPV